MQREVSSSTGWGFCGFCEVKRVFFIILSPFLGMVSLGKNTLFLAYFRPRVAQLVSNWDLKPIFFLHFSGEKSGAGGYPGYT